VVVSAAELSAGVARLGAEVSAAYDDDLVLVGVLKGSVVFMADLVRTLHIAPVIDFLALSTYAQGTGRIRLVKDIETDISGRHVVIVEDVVDTGLTLAFLTAELGRRQPASVAVCTLLDKAVRRIVPTELAFVGFEVPDVFLLGYGLDFAGRYRNLRLLAAGDPDVLAVDPDAYVAQLYPPGAPGLTQA
jgi:hypoxanthine phosphoribosyltransferase